MWEVIALALLFAITFGVAIYMVTRTRRPEVTIIQQPEGTNTDVEALAVKIAEAVAVKVAEKVAQEFIDKLGTVGYTGSKQSPSMDGIEIDESIIPMKVEVEFGGANLDGMAEEREEEDGGLEESKSKLASILKKKDK